MLEMFETEFMQRAWLAGLIVAVICPLIGSFLVLRRQSMIGDGLGHIAFAGVAGGALMGWQPVLSAAAVTVFGALVIEWVRTRLAAFSEMILAIFFYSGIGLAVVFTSMNRMGGFNLSSILFGSLMTISSSDLWIVAGLGIFACIFVVLFYRPLQYLTFDETSARVAGLPADRLNMWLAVLTAQYRSGQSALPALLEARRGVLDTELAVNQAEREMARTWAAVNWLIPQELAQ